MEAQELSRRFQRHLAYCRALAWKKPFIDPRRFITNQSRKLGFIASQPGTLRTVPAFHVRNFTVVSGEGVSEEIAGYGIHEPNLTAALLRLIKPSEVVVDIGMHLGYYAALFALLVGERG